MEKISGKPIIWVLLATFFLVPPLISGCAREEKGAEQYYCPMHPTYITDRPGDCPICGMRVVPMEEQKASAKKPKYTCPMHPEVASDTPGKCPECGMDLVPREEEGETREAGSETAHTRGGPPTTGDRKILFYRNPMNPNVTSPVPAKDSMGMDYVPVYADEATPETSLEDLAPIVVSEPGLRLAGVQTAVATREEIVRVIRTVGLVVPDERRVRHVHTKISGWIENLTVNFTGQQVQEGQPILSIYSPELLASQEEYLTALRLSSATPALPGAPENVADSLVRPSKRRLELFDVPPEFIKRLEETGSPQRTVTLVAPVSGFVTFKGTFEGQQVEPGMDLFTIADLSYIWIQADFYEYEAHFVEVGQWATIRFPYDSSLELKTPVTYVDPVLDVESRTLKVRFEADNADLRFKPGMYVDVDLEIESAKGVVVPDSAVMDTGRRKVVFLGRSGGRFEPREVEVGLRDKGKAQILRGVESGDLVVIRANFLLDSESRLRAAVSGITGGAGHAGPGDAP